MLQRITKRELIQAQIALFIAILLQVIAWRIGEELLPGSQYVLVITEIVLAVLIGITANMKRAGHKNLHHVAAIILLGLISGANISALIFVLNSLIVGHATVVGEQLLTSAIAIFMTNVIVYALWYWEIDSPGLTRTRWSKHDKDFQFIQQDLKNEFPGWQPEFFDYFYLSVTNAVNFAPADTRPLTRQAKFLMTTQALVSVFTIALVVARSVSILGS